MDFYHRYPMMKPFVGQHFADRRKPSILLVGESHYLPLPSSVHLDASAWYAGSGDNLDAQEKDWISTATNFKKACQERFKNKAHSIWKYSLTSINKAGPDYAEPERVAEDVAFYNFFLRPAVQGRSLGVTAQDKGVANEAFAHWCAELKPRLVMFLSALAHGSLNGRSSATPPIAVVPHPASSWWNRRSARYGGNTGREQLEKIVSALDWPPNDESG